MGIANIRKLMGLPVTPAVPAKHQPPRGPVTILKHCRCIDCRHWVEARRIKQHYCQALIPTSAEPDQWHWCAGYAGPEISKETIVWKYNRTA